MESWQALLKRHYLYNDISSLQGPSTVSTAGKGQGGQRMHAGCKGRVLGEGASLSGDEICRPSKVPGCWSPWQAREEGSWEQRCYDPFLLLLLLLTYLDARRKGQRIQGPGSLFPISPSRSTLELPSTAVLL